MTFFGLGNILLKVRRKELRHPYRAGWLTVFVAITATSLGVLGNIILDYRNFLFFLEYFVPTVLLALIMFFRIPLLKAILLFANYVMTKILIWRTVIIDNITAITQQRVMIFTRGGPTR